MRRGFSSGVNTEPFTLASIKKMEQQGYKYVQIKGLTHDRQYDYIGPHFLVLVPMKELPTEQAQKDIYEPIKSNILKQWAAESDEHFEVVVAHMN